MLIGRPIALGHDGHRKKREGQGPVDFFHDHDSCLLGEEYVFMKGGLQAG